jgi:hypothetical protein
MSVNPTDLLADRHKGYRQAPGALPACRGCAGGPQQRVAEFESELAAAESHDRINLGDALVDGHRPSRPEADSVRPRLDEAKRDAEALAYAEERAAGALGGLPREHKEEWLRAAMRSLDKARNAYTAAIGELARAHDQLSDEAVLVSFLENNGQFSQAIGGGIQRPMSDGTIQTIDFSQLTELMLKEAASVKEKALLDPNRPMPELQFHQAMGGGSKSWE